MEDMPGGYFASAMRVIMHHIPNSQILFWNIISVRLTFPDNIVTLHNGKGFNFFLNKVDIA